ncbi:MAG: ATP synthase F1 subunit delta [Bacteroidia bacterium]|nr:ATP synthase F1 subunit delta [Bacteroidia bacterium]
MIVASRYSKSLIDLAVEKKQLDAVYNDVVVIKQACDTANDFQTFLKSPIIKTDKKVEILKAIFSSKLNELTFAFIMLLAKKKRENILLEVCNAFIEDYNKFKNITSATIITAVKLDDASRKKALEIVKGVSSGEVVLNEKVNPELIGGFVLRVGDKQVDNSVSRQLQNLKKNFNTKTVSIN